MGKTLVVVATSVAAVAVAAGCQQPYRSRSTQGAASVAQTATSISGSSGRLAPNAVPSTSQDPALRPKLDARESDEVLQVVNRLSLVDQACKRRRCSLTLDND